MPTLNPQASADPFSLARPNSVPAAIPNWPKVIPDADCCDRSNPWRSSMLDCAYTGPPPTAQLSVSMYARFGWKYTVLSDAFCALNRPGKVCFHCDVRPYGTY